MVLMGMEAAFIISDMGLLTISYRFIFNGSDTRNGVPFNREEVLCTHFTSALLSLFDQMVASIDF